MSEKLKREQRIVIAGRVDILRKWLCAQGKLAVRTLAVNFGNCGVRENGSLSAYFSVYRDTEIVLPLCAWTIFERNSIMCAKARLAEEPKLCCDQEVLIRGKYETRTRSCAYNGGTAAY